MLGTNIGKALKKEIYALSYAGDAHPDHPGTTIESMGRPGLCLSTSAHWKSNRHGLGMVDLFLLRENAGFIQTSSGQPDEKQSFSVVCGGQMGL
jgi:hypothetical protein